MYLTGSLLRWIIHSIDLKSENRRSGFFDIIELFEEFILHRCLPFP